MSPLVPVRAPTEGLVRAHLVVVRPRVDDPVIPLRFNPSEYQLEKANTFAEVTTPGLDAPPIQFVRGGGERLSAELLADTSDTLDDVRARYVDRVRNLMRVNGSLHAPPILRLIWDRSLFEGVLESLSVTYVLFSPVGTPLRAKMRIALKEYRPASVQVRETPRQSPDVEKAYVVRRGDTLSAIAAELYGDPAAWRAIARANGVRDPRRLEPGRVLTIPALT